MRVSRRYVNSSGPAAQLVAFNLPTHTNRSILTSVEQPSNVRAGWMTDVDQAPRRVQPQP